MESEDEVVVGTTLYRVSPSGRLHIPGCSHLQVTDRDKLVEASPEDRARLELCSECGDEIRGVGRRTFASLDAALEALPLAVENRPRVREIVRDVEHSRVWIPNGGSYVALGYTDGRPAAAYVNRGFVDVRDESLSPPYERHELPNFAGRGIGGAAGRAERPTATCPQCHMSLPASGVCECSE
ncbi:hypothetical protein [Cellulomonas sp. PhB143]|uniref:hypothetical protein n=1 Tax=Cellulomonas sp. PhB143 TaxID=2485186 RepID=UPI000F49CD9B|nr:hypothetical protein [Cellulomonas sp. PhB143]ROS79129.1 hypothetical protein EDF32_0011 [Cellulomonas sp. PhB143]